MVWGIAAAYAATPPDNVQAAIDEAPINQMCDVDGCTLQIYLWNGATAWNLAFDEAVKSYKFVSRHGEHLLQVVMAGQACGKPTRATCHLTYRLNKDSVDPMQ